MTEMESWLETIEPELRVMTRLFGLPESVWDPPARFVPKAEEEDGCYRITFSDSGEPFDPLAREDADTSEAALLERDGGLGILLVKKLMDGVSYRYSGGRNVLTIEKRK